MYLLKRILVIVVSIALMATMCFALFSLAEPESRIYCMIFDRGLIQFLTLYAFALIVTLLCCRLVICFHVRRQLQRLEEGNYDWRNHEFSLGEHLHTVRKLIAKHGGNAALSCTKYFAQQRKDDIHKAYELINFLVCSLPAFGLLGTMLGLSKALFTAFSGGKAGPESVNLFVSSLGTALDTTVLALICALVVGAFVWLLNRSENELIERETNFICNLFSLDQVHFKSKEPKTKYSEDEHRFVLVENLKDEIQPLITEIVAETVSKFDKSLQNVAEFCREGVSQAVNEILRKQQTHEEIAVEKITKNLNESISRIGTVIARHNNHAANTVVSGLRHIVRTLDKRIPNELVIRYNHDEEVSDIITNLEVSNVA